MTFTGFQARPQLWTEKRISEAKAEGSSNVEAKWEYFHVSTYCMVTDRRSLAVPLAAICLFQLFVLKSDLHLPFL